MFNEQGLLDPNVEGIDICFMFQEHSADYEQQWLSCKEMTVVISTARLRLGLPH